MRLFLEMSFNFQLMLDSFQYDGLEWTIQGAGRLELKSKSLSKQQLIMSKQVSIYLKIYHTFTKSKINLVRLVLTDC